ncbi:MAG: sigma-54 dependent transcriptional regulator [Clostridia bacterium]
MSEIKSFVSILLVDDEPDFARGIARLIQKGFPGNPVMVKQNGEEALELLQTMPYGIMITDMRMPCMNGLELLEKALAVVPSLTVIVLTGFGTIETAVAAVKKGAYDFLTKPVDQDILFRTVRKGLERAGLIRENNRLREAAAGCLRFEQMIGESPSMRQLQKEIETVAAADYTVLIRGESGVGKELAAKAIHRLSRRGDKPLVSVNCTAVSENILESELFGHVRGAFTGAVKARQGLFQAADGSSLHLDEIGDMPIHLQPKLLRALQEREIRPVGGSVNIRVDVRILASTNQRLESLISAGAFREDLYYRLNVLTIRIPSLRERQKDIPLLAVHFLRESCIEMGIGDKEFSPNALEYLSQRSWPGNVRELLNFVRRLAVFSSGQVITDTQIRLMDSIGKTALSGASGNFETYREAKERFLDDFTRTYIRQALEHTGGNISQAARLSGLERVSLQKILRRLHIDAGEFREKERVSD